MLKLLLNLMADFIRLLIFASLTLALPLLYELKLCKRYQTVKCLGVHLLLCTIKSERDLYQNNNKSAD